MDLRREAVRLRDELQTTLHVPAKIRWGGLGELTVTVDGRTVFSKRQAGRVPEPGEIARLVEPPR
jgi:Rdx family protein